LLTLPIFRKHASLGLQLRTEIVASSGAHLRILLVMPAERRHEIARQLLPLNAQLVFADPSGRTEGAIEEDDIFHVAILPATLANTDWWKLWGVLELLNKRPAILVYAREITFQLWAGVLESGGFDVIVEPFSDSEIRAAVSRAAESFEGQGSNGC
jgi:PleD family two-component response regulator